MNQHETEIEIDFWALLKHLRKKAGIILAAAVLFVLAGILFSLIFIRPQYTATTRIYVLNRTNENTVVSADFQVSNYMINDYKELIKGRNVTQEVIEDLGLRMSNNELSQKITVSSPKDTRILQIEVTDPDPAQARQIADAVREVTSTQLMGIMQVDSVTTIYTANLPQTPSSPNVKMNGIIAGLVGLALAIAIYAIVFIADDRIRTEEDVEQHLGLSIMGVIPDKELLLQKTVPKGRIVLARHNGKRGGR